MSDIVQGSRKIHAKWGFGLAPEKPAMRARREHAVHAVIKILESDSPLTERCSPDSISEVKGLFTRSVRQDQWDWFLVWAQLGRPPLALSSAISKRLLMLRRSLLANEQGGVETAIKDLRSFDTTRWLISYLKEECDWGNGCVYIMSTREMPDVLKVGFSKRSPAARAKEINSATGVMIPFGVRAAWRVDDPKFLEREVHDLLADYRIRSDREFFRVDFNTAFRTINDHLKARQTQKFTSG